jgi:hypothetical protein
VRKVHHQPDATLAAALVLDTSASICICIL